MKTRAARGRSPDTGIRAVPVPTAPAVIAPEQVVRANIAQWAIPLGFGAAQAVVTYILVWVALAAPPKQPGFRGIDNDTTSAGSQRRLAMYRQAVDWIPGLGPHGLPHLTPAVYLWGLRAALIALALLQLAALLTCLREAAESRPAPWLAWLIGPAATLVVLLAYPPLSSDVFYYAISGHVANEGFNPYFHTPNQFPFDPFLPFNDWTNIPSPYGPLWTTFSRLLVFFTGASPVRAVVGFKIVAGTAALGLAVVVYRLALRMTGNPARALGALVLVAWAPPLLIESAGTAHNDAAMLLCAVAGLWLMTVPRLGAVRGGLVLIAASTLIKYVTLPLLGMAILWRLRDRSAHWTTLLDRWLADLAAIALLAAAVFAPYWAGEATIKPLIKEPARLFVNPLWVLPRLAVATHWGTSTGDAFRDHTRSIAFWAAIGLIAAACLWLLARSWRVRRQAEPEAIVSPARLLRLQSRAWAVAVAALALVPVNAHAWYAIWAVGPVALAWASLGPADEATASRPRITWWLLAYLVWTTISFTVYHTRAPN